ncbi:MAG: transporter [Flavobacteriaceae bacterium]|nr:transporter [Flavobacteriaceae bacterium]
MLRYCSIISVIFDLMHTTQKLVLVILLVLSSISWGQYTPIINSNRPGASMGAFGVGPGVYQVEWGNAYRSGSFERYANASFGGWGSAVAFRTGLFTESFELIYQLDFQLDQLQFQNRRGTVEGRRSGLKNHSIGFKYVLFDPFRYPEWYKPNLYSWKANQGVRWIDLVPVISFYGGVEIVLDNTYPYATNFKPLFDFGIEKYKPSTFSGTFQFITQNHLGKDWVLTTNWGTRYFGTAYESNFHTIGLTVNLNERWSAFVEEHNTKSKLFSDATISTGIAHLLSRDLQMDMHISRTTKKTPQLFEWAVGFSYRIDKHIDRGEPQEKIIKDSFDYYNRSNFQTERAYLRMLRKREKEDRKIDKEQRRIERKLNRIK